MGMIKITDVNFQYDGAVNPVFNNLNINIDEKWKLGLIGRNGRGKTTLLKILLGQLKYQGAVQTNLTFRYFPQPVNDPKLETSEVVLQQAQLDDAEIWRIQAELPALQLSDDVLWRPFNTLSPVEQTKVQLAALFCQPQSFQLIDEPTNHLDQAGRQVVADYLKNKHGFIVVSHDRHFINQIIDHVVAIERQQVQLLNGNYDTWQASFDQQNQFEAKVQAKLQHEIKQLQASATQTKRWAGKAEGQKQQKNQKEQHANLDKGFLGHKAAKIMKRSKAAEDKAERAVSEKRELLKNVDEVSALTMAYQPLRTNQPLLTVTDLQVKHTNDWLAQPVSFQIEKGERVFLTGNNGSGKSSILTALQFPDQIEHRGAITWASQVRASFLEQTFTELRGSLTNYAKQHHLQVEQFFNLLRKLGFERASFQTPLEEMSMGQQRKIGLARSLGESANLYVWDEPLNYLDLLTRQQIEEVILASQATMLIIDHDVDFMKRVATQPAVPVIPLAN
ncbi:ATP-binding cassette domain-containing protein [Lentilactobacillus senioris]|uniref:ribosomal protection-like ABC-F family protein n=1 Tax=Lentilactobacillus senioris TaxID=931534 RepID=UPI002281EB28|nr:ATP-binding cassette domain-containing protein [Lentilactobacillus senioris]MCY9806274.1 ATP-binding cassette domain-containing protein [Lentilactobacillus senioris]